MDKDFLFIPEEEEAVLQCVKTMKKLLESKSLQIQNADYFLKLVNTSLWKLTYGKEGTKPPNVSSIIKIN